MSSRFRRYKIPTFARLIPVGLLLGCLFGCKSNEAPATVRASETNADPGPVVPASERTPALSRPSSFTAYGPLVAEQQADVGSQRNGRIAAVAVRIGDRVRAGQVLAQLDDAVLHANYDAQKARLAVAQAGLQAWHAEELMNSADLHRADKLREAKVISEEVWEHTKYKLDETVDGRARYESEVAVAQAELAATRLQLEQSQILAPFDGIVGRVSVRADQMVKEGDVLFWVTAEGPLQVLFTVPELSMAQFSAGTALELTTADYPGMRQAGHVLHLSPVIDPASASIQVIGALDHPSPLLKPGMSMQVRRAHEPE
jgi:membrane fusion protein (multidrug efflux system)